MPDTLISRRKSEHLRVVAEQDVTHSGSTLLEDVRLFHEALPELDYDELRLSTPFFGRTLRLPFMITSMTGGAEYADRLNHGLARVAERTGIAFAVGSQRVMLNHPELAAQFVVREQIPTGVLLGNIGAVQLIETPVDTVAGLANAIDADGICVHLNPAQELVQLAGDRTFRGLIDGISRLHERMDGRVLVKETGGGLSPQALERLRAIGVKVVDVAGAGGTSWTKVESHREANRQLQRSGRVFAEWGVPTAFSVYAAREVLGRDATVVASGGIRSGLDAARAIALGADIAGFAHPVLLSFLDGGEDSAVQFIETLAHELKMAMLLTGTADVSALKRAPRVIEGRLRRLIDAHPWHVEKDRG
ncbi:MAG: Isopentenyl-diphosphate delta-isomerase [Calditrichaeota bacterium]|nr:Isopentenyl-diphosphate delta-isomerase [Calditrichota bacterium]